MPDPKKFDLDYRPESYWDEHESIFANIKGDLRKNAIRQAAKDGSLEEIPKVLFAESLPGDLRDRLGAIHPQNMGGEYLPDYEEDEIQIAQISLASTTRDVISVRARRVDEWIEYRIEDEYDTEFDCDPTDSRKPLSLGELIALIDGAKDERFESRGLVNNFRTLEMPFDPRERASFVQVSSDYYSQLGDWYGDEAREWLNELLQEE